MRRIFMASLVLVVFAAAMVVFQMSSCKKAVAQKDCPTPTYQIAGLWIGTYQTDQFAHEPTYFSLIINPDRTLIVKAKGVPPAQDVVYSTGTWTLTGNIFEFTDTTYNYSSKVIQAGKLTYSNTGTLTGGTWKNLSGDNGRFYTGTYPSMLRVN